MVFDSLKRLFKGDNKTQKTQERSTNNINEEIEEYEREIQEYIHYTESRHVTGSPPPNQQPQELSQGKGMAGSTSLVTPEEEKRIQGEEN